MKRLHLQQPSPLRTLLPERYHKLFDLLSLQEKSNKFIQIVTWIPPPLFASAICTYQ